MRRIIILVIATVLVFGLSACAVTGQNLLEVNNVDKADGIEQKPIGENNMSGDVKDEANEQIGKTYSVPSGSVTPIYFKSETELKDVIMGKTTLQHGPWNPETVTSLAYYFKPEYLPEEVCLSYISVHDSNVAFCYEFDQPPDEWKSNVFLLEWFRSLKAGDMEKNVGRWFSDSEIEHYMGYDIYIYKVTDELEKKEFSRQDIFWEQNGYVFHAIVPMWFTKEDIEKYCVAKKVVVK